MIQRVRLLGKPVGGIVNERRDVSNWILHTEDIIRAVVGNRGQAASGIGRGRQPIERVVTERAFVVQLVDGVGDIRGCIVRRRTTVSTGSYKFRTRCSTSIPSPMTRPATR